MESNNIWIQLVEALYDDYVKATFDPNTGTLCLVKDYMNGMPVWRAPNEEDVQIYKEEITRRRKYE